MLSGLVLAGGKSSRMGREKAELRLADGRTLLQRQIDLLHSIGAKSVNVSVGPGKVFQMTGAIPVPDELPDAGPLAGIAAGLRAAPAGLVLVLAVDMPGINEAHLRQLAALATAPCGVVPVHAGICEALVAVYPSDLAGSAHAWLTGGKGAPQAWARSEVTRGRLRLWEAPADWAGALRSWNSPGELPSG